MKILSLFDGIATAYVALERAGIKVDKYYASEIDKNAIKIAQKNHPSIIQLGDIKELDGVDEEIDLMCGGFPCPSFSSAGLRKGFEDERGKLFYDLVRLFKKIKPKYFLFENVKMKKEYQDIISGLLGVEPLDINSSLLSSQNRRRLYWTNIPNITQPEDKGLVLRDILLDDEKDKEYLKDFFMNEKQIAGVEKSNYRDRKPMDINKKSNCLKVGGDVKRIIDDNGKWRYLTPIEYEALQTLPRNYTEGIAKTNRYKAVGNGWTVDIISHIFKNIV